MYQPKGGKSFKVRTVAFGKPVEREIKTDLITGIRVRGLETGTVEAGKPNAGMKYIQFKFGKPINLPEKVIDGVLVAAKTIEKRATCFNDPDNKEVFEFMSTVKDGDILNLHTVPTSKISKSASGVQYIPLLNKIVGAEPGKVAEVVTE